MGENRNRRVWIFADELPTLHKLPDTVEILPEARKFGGCYVFGIQSYAQLEDIYGVKPAATLFDVMNTRAFFRSPSKEIAEFAAGEIGEKEILKASEQYSTVLTRCVMVYRPGKKRAGNAGQLLRYSDAA
uniref:Coupling protein TraD n=1 Tax=Klebsiella pneumoniae TaxID=573 RepID=A0A2P1BPV1_KLEPN|nr:Coupling protein TraD [Klebsiella pneumoniae]